MQPQWSQLVFLAVVRARLGRRGARCGAWCILVHRAQDRERLLELLLRGGERLLSGGSLCLKKKSNVGV